LDADLYLLVERINMLKRHTRLSDVVARYGGEEFAVILPYADYSNALIVGERFRKAVEDSDFDGIRVTISVGLAHFEGGDTRLDHKRFIDIADRALYKAKENGRNRVEIT
jgi:diguanylate cyclase (GGDEF)-like protein